MEPANDAKDVMMLALRGGGNASFPRMSVESYDVKRNLSQNKNIHPTTTLLRHWTWTQQCPPKTKSSPPQKSPLRQTELFQILLIKFSEDNALRTHPQQKLLVLSSKCTTPIFFCT